MEVAVIIVILYPLLIFWDLVPIIKSKQRKEFWVGTILFAFSFGILFTQAVGVDLPILSHWITRFFDLFKVSH